MVDRPDQDEKGSCGVGDIRHQPVLASIGVVSFGLSSQSCCENTFKSL
jgi:hypothetical protein